MSTLMGKAWYATIPLPGARSVPLSVGEVFMLAAVAWLGIIALAAGAHPPLALCGLGAGFAAVFLRAGKRSDLRQMRISHGFAQLVSDPTNETRTGQTHGRQP